jgi:hypothetical protein
MKPRRSSIAATLVRAWTRLYTVGMPREPRDQRRAEIESDLWESEQQDAIVRLIRGMPADLGWRIEHVDGAHPLHTALQLMTTLGLVVGALVWVFASFGQSELALPPLPPAPIFAVERRSRPSPPPPPPTWHEFVARVNTFNKEPVNAQRPRLPR